MTKSNNSADRSRARDREVQALELRKAGATYAQIADRLGMSERGAGTAVARRMAQLETAAIETAEEIRRLELERLDAMLFAIGPEVRKGSYGAIDRALKIMERRARLLGLDAPVKGALTDPSGEKSWSPTMTDEELTKRLNDLAQRVDS